MPSDQLRTDLTVWGEKVAVITIREPGQPAGGPAHQRAHTTAVKEAVTRLYAEGRERGAQAAYDAIRTAGRQGRHPRTGAWLTSYDLAPVVRDMILRRKFTFPATGEGPAKVRKGWPKVGVPSDPAAAGRKIALNIENVIGGVTFEEVNSEDSNQG